MSEEKKLDEFELDDAELESVAGGGRGKSGEDMSGVTFTCNKCKKDIYCKNVQQYGGKNVVRWNYPCSNSNCDGIYNVFFSRYAIDDTNSNGVANIRWHE